MNEPKRSWLPWIAISVLALCTLVLVVSFASRLLNPPITPYAGENTAKPEQIQLEVINASGISGVGKQAMAYLRERGFDVVEIHTDTAKQQRSYIIDRIGDRSSSIKVAQVMGIADTLIKTDIDSMLFLRASVILGTDCTKLSSFDN